VRIRGLDRELTAKLGRALAHRGDPDAGPPRGV
jgi:hypothetical protein